MNPLSRLIFQLGKLPGVGEKSATRLAYFILNQDPQFSREFAQAILDAREQTRLCRQCFHFSTEDVCEICTDTKRDLGTICVVERPSDIAPLERVGSYRGFYHVLHGLLSPMDGIGPEQIKVKGLLETLKTRESVQEVIFALNPSVEGDATQLYLSRLLKPLGIRVTQVAYGIPLGGSIEFTDRQTLGKALENRNELR